MYKKLGATFLTVFILLGFNAQAQINETFNDGDFTNNPTWTGSSNADWFVNPALQLQSNNQVASSTFYLSTPNTLATQTQWEFWVKLDFNTSSLNYVDAYLTASASNISATATTGYFVRLGNTEDDICLYRKDANGSSVKIIDGVDAVLNNSTNTVKIKVIRAAGNQWTLFRDLTGTGSSYVAEGSVTDATYTTSSYFGFLVKQSTSSFFQKHYFDDIVVQTYIPDVTPPAIQAVSAVAPNAIDVLFNEPVDAATAQTVTNYVVNNSVGSPTTATRDANNTNLVHLTFANNFPSGVNNTITINGVKDIAGNAITNGTATFSFYIPQRYDVVIDEIMADPSPVVSLPDAEYVELKNISGKAINLQGWKITSSSTTSAPFGSYVLPADSFLILTGTSSVSLFAPYGRVMGVTSFPALTNDAATLSLISKEGLTIHSVSYNTSWYKNDVKSNGGWSLEMIDTHNPCNGADNWTSSVDTRGGTPGTKNSVDAANPDKKAPALVRAAATDSLTVILTFSEPVDSLKAGTAANYAISDGINTPVRSITISPAFNKVQLTLATPLSRTKVYTVTASNVTDCSGNVIQAVNSARVGLASPIDSFGIVINEILFNPKANGVDYVEIYNRSDKIYDLKNLSIATRPTSAITSIRQVSTESLLLFPGDYFVLSSSGDIVKQQYFAKNPDNFIDVASFPAYANDKGDVVLLNAQGTIVDELRYDEKWHFSLISNDEGISLERIDYNKPTQDKNNWTSAASTVGFGTPSYQNSQFRTDAGLQGEVTITPKVFSPDNDGFDDFTILSYKLTDPTFVGNITIFDAAGRPVRVLAKNATLAQTGNFRWDGLDDKQRKVPVGTYVIYTEVFNLSGKKKSFKNTVVVAARF
jgi:hypothetical protein